MAAVANLIVRKAQPAELPAVADITRASYSEYEKESDPDFWRNYESGTRATLLEGKDESLVALLDGKIVASVLYCKPYEWIIGEQTVKNVYPEMRLLAVLPECRNLKVGARLIEVCEEKARTEGFDAITLHTTVLMQTAKAMYERRGYLPYPAIDFSPVPGFTVWGFKKVLRK
ncbi:MAG: GNAT family N-acetyltransferase [Cyanobacteria bacterium SZAS LIN-3]|nr:GNAT family N-acetyltransferase [Cyanobacteria bacterium SZAS LIN-3]